MKATYIVHWPGQDTLACDEHTVKLRSLGSFMGISVASTPVTDADLECANCQNEAQRKERAQ